MSRPPRELSPGECAGVLVDLNLAIAGSDRIDIGVETVNLGDLGENPPQVASAFKLYHGEAEFLVFLFDQDPTVRMGVAELHAIAESLLATTVPADTAAGYLETPEDTKGLRNRTLRLDLRDKLQASAKAIWQESNQLWNFAQDLSRWDFIDVDADVYIWDMTDWGAVQ